MKKYEIANQRTFPFLAVATACDHYLLENEWQENRSIEVFIFYKYKL